jgi:pimeloyl-ACP methyl ester carboxylesterase
MLCGSELAGVPAGIPVEVHCGAADVVTPPAACEQAARALGASFSLVAGAGHASPVEQAAAVAALLAAALQQARGENKNG